MRHGVSEDSKQAGARKQRRHDSEGHGERRQSPFQTDVVCNLRIHGFDGRTGLFRSTRSTAARMLLTMAFGLDEVRTNRVKALKLPWPPSCAKGTYQNRVGVSRISLYLAFWVTPTMV